MFSLSAGNSHDVPEGRKLIECIRTAAACHLLMDRAYEDDATRRLVINRGFNPVVPPKSNSRGNMTKNFTSDEMRLKNYSAESNASVEYLPDMKNSTLYSRHL